MASYWLARTTCRTQARQLTNVLATEATLTRFANCTKKIRPAAPVSTEPGLPHSKQPITIGALAFRAVTSVDRRETGSCDYATAATFAASGHRAGGFWDLASSLRRQRDAAQRLAR